MSRHGLDWDDPRLDGFWSQRRYATVTTLRRDGRPHTVPVAPVVDRTGRRVLILAAGSSQKVRNVEAAGGEARVTVCEIDGRHWVTVEGRAHVVRDPAVVADAERRYAERFRQPRVNPERVIVVVDVDRLLGTLGER
ncbi:pyridoxamine 5'-phosphate oxidase family protein [Arsenicicoccus sp. oral taxon 190]|uniref:pyridoxamine 5'-phosphate oxidase family protein n=1 Tax=Arsenicicoccus sp. oral taxon 190 TaxID=1658671 RepID=UPI00067A0C8F|nr:TIGR03618 family F420-dependent PPOX class oxidoreductase [Arsenicicoccus sp. oral taxon 190]AKT50661.1 hypothetical protein ADJ73_03885 [Arsenicicoccus sp. oral taxon 190]